MTSPADPGATGRRARSGATSQASAAPEGAAPLVETETSAAALATAGTAAEVAQAAEQPVVIGAAEIPLEPGGPGAGAARVAEEVEGVASRPVAGSAADDGRLSASERTELEILRQRERADRVSWESRDRTSPEVRRDHEVYTRAYRDFQDEAAGRVVDAAKIREIRIAQAATQILRDGKSYRAGEPVPVDFAAYTELVGIGAIVKDRWADLLLVGEA
ncbi:hypothetical protein [Methylorubrum zatmanii]